MNTQSSNSLSLRTGRDGAAVFNAIVALVRNRTELDYATAFNKVLADNSDLLKGQLDATTHGEPLLRLLNRTQSATGLSPTASTDLAADKIQKLTQHFFPSLTNAPTALQWDILVRAALQLEKCGIPQRLFNRTGDPEINSADWKAANDHAKDVLDWLDEKAFKSKDFGTHEKFKSMPPRHKFWCFSNQIKQLMTDEGLSQLEAFNKLKETQPIFWAHSILGFEQDRDIL